MVFTVLLLLFIKHFVVDFPLQAFPWIYLNKGTYGHLGGIVHAVLHGVFTFAIFWYWSPQYAVALGAIDAVIHYHVDWAKMNLNKKMGWTATNSEWFWIFIGVDQLLHALTYFGLVYLVM